jgi:hypothetical protein
MYFFGKLFKILAGLRLYVISFLVQFFSEES